jgi:UDP-N-acetylmuramoyl-tripeptide--D-alanyl-D-alanine ligase
MSVSLWAADTVAQATGGTVFGNFSASGVAFDSREVGTGDLFIAMRGEFSDGHRFIDQAIASGAAGVICETPVDHPHVAVGNSFAALQELGTAARLRSTAAIIGVTGSAGKTSTKEALFAALERIAPGAAHRSVKSYNNHTGVPLSLARMPADTRFGVFEMGMNHAGEIADLTRMVRPHVAIITTIAPAHIENLGSEEAIADAKAEIFEGIEPGGVAIIPFDSPWRDRLIAAAIAHGVRVQTFGLGKGADVRAQDWVSTPDGGTLITAQFSNNKTLCFTLSQSGEHWVSNAMAVLAAVDAVGGDLATAGLALADLGGLAGRGERHNIQAGQGTALMIDESYNANPASMAATLAQLGRTDADRRVVVLGTMRELGADSPRFHAEIAAPIAAAGVSLAILVGEQMEHLANALANLSEAHIEVCHVGDAEAALATLQTRILAGDAVLVKGSNAIGLSHIIKTMANAGAAGHMPNHKDSA